MAVTIYQLVAKGPLAEFDGASTIYSRKVFNIKAQAEEYQPDFIKACVTRRSVADFSYLLRVDKIQVVELELG